MLATKIDVQFRLGNRFPGSKKYRDQAVGTQLTDVCCK